MVIKGEWASQRVESEVLSFISRILGNSDKHTEDDIRFIIESATRRWTFEELLCKIRDINEVVSPNTLGRFPKLRLLLVQALSCVLRWKILKSKCGEHGNFDDNKGIKGSKVF